MDRSCQKFGVDAAALLLVSFYYINSSLYIKIITNSYFSSSSFTITRRANHSTKLMANAHCRLFSNLIAAQHRHHNFTLRLLTIHAVVTTAKRRFSMLFFTHHCTVSLLPTKSRRTRKFAQRNAHHRKIDEIIIFTNDDNTSIYHHLQLLQW